MKIIKKAWEKGLIHIFTGSFLTKVISFFGSTFLVRVLSKQDYGILGYLENIYGYVFVIAGMGMSNAILRYVILGETAQEKYNFFFYAYKKGIVWNGVLSIIAILGCYFYPHPISYQPSIKLLYILLLALPFQYIIDNVLCNERAMFANQRYARFSLIFSAILISVKIVFGYIGGIASVILGQTTIYVILAVVFFLSTQKKYYCKLKPADISLEWKIKIDLYSFQYMITNGLWAIFMLNDVFLLGRFCQPEIIAEYKVAYTIPGSVSIINTAIGIFVLPYFVKNENDKQWIQLNFKKIYFVTAVCIGGVCSVLACLAKPIIWLLYGEQYFGIKNIMVVLLLSAFMNCGLRYTTANILAAMGKIKYNMMISFIGMLLQIIIDLMVIPHYGAIGVAITSCVVYGFMAVCLLLIFWREYYRDCTKN